MTLLQPMGEPREGGQGCYGYRDRESEEGGAVPRFSGDVEGLCLDRR